MVEASSNPAPKVAVYEAAVPEPLMGEAHDHSHDHVHEDEHDHAEEATGEEALAPDPHITVL